MSNRSMISSNQPYGLNYENGDDMMTHSNGNTVYTRDILVTMSDHDLRSAERDLARKINRLRSFSDDARTRVEVELCYVQDEIFRRSEAARLAEEYVARHGASSDAQGV